MRLEHHLVGGYVRYISPHVIIIMLNGTKCTHFQLTSINKLPAQLLERPQSLIFVFIVCTQTHDTDDSWLIERQPDVLLFSPTAFVNGMTICR